MAKPNYMILYPRQIILVTSFGTYKCKEKDNICTLAWSTPTSFSPEFVAISVNNASLSFELILETEEFAINIPSIDMKDKVLLCGTTSGRTTDKFKESGLTKIPAEKIKPKLIKECLASIECDVVDSIKTGDHTLFIGEIIAACENKKNKEKILMDHGGRDFFGI